MKGLLWLLALAAAALAVAMLARAGSGYVLIAAGGYRVELSLTLAVVLLALLLVAAYFLLRLLAGALALPGWWRERRQRGRQRRSHRHLVEALTAYFEGSFAAAEKAAARALKLGEDRALAATVAARAAQRRRLPERRDEYLKSLSGVPAPERRVAELARAEFMLAHDPRGALRVVEGIRAADRRPPPGALQLALKARQRLQDWDEVLALLPEAQKTDALDPAAVDQLKRRALAEGLRARGDDAETLKRHWKTVAARDREDPPGGGGRGGGVQIVWGEPAGPRGHRGEPGAGVVAPSCCRFTPSPPTAMLRARSSVPRAGCGRHPDDAVLLLTLGRLCAHAGLWGKAQSYMEASLSVEPTYSAYLALAELDERLGRPEAARDAYRKSLDLALAQLRSATGGAPQDGAVTRGLRPATARSA